MAGIKVARSALLNAGMDVNVAQEFMDKANNVFGLNWACTPGGIGVGSNLLLSAVNFRAFLAARPLAPDVVISIPIPSAKPTSIIEVGLEVADYYETEAGKFQCNHCDRKPYAREASCIKHLETKHADKLEE